MSDVFGSDYANAYDVIYQDKDYEAECDVIERVFKKCGGKTIKDILDLGCGTGNHVFPLARRGFNVTGVDRSEAMIAGARKKTADGESKAIFQQGDIRSIDLRKQFDAVIMMFAVLGYQTENDDVLSALQTARRHLQPGGLFIFDIWYGPAVLTQRPSERAKVIPTAKGKVLRLSSGDLDMRRHVCRVKFHMWHMEDRHVVSETNESHDMRYFFPLELELLLKSTEFKLLHLGAFPQFEEQPDENTWNVMGVAQAL